MSRAKETYKPSSVPDVIGGRPSILARRYRRAPAANPGTGRAPCVPLFGLAPGEVYPPLMSPPEAVSSYLTISPLPLSRRYVSVALSIGLPRLGVTQHPARWSSDFPPRRLSPSGRPPGLLDP